MRRSHRARRFQLHLFQQSLAASMGSGAKIGHSLPTAPPWRPNCQPGIIGQIRFQAESWFTAGRLLKHSARFHFEDGERHLQLIDGLSNFRVFTNLVPQSFQQIVSSRHMLCSLLRAGVRSGFALLLHDMHLWSKIVPLFSEQAIPRLSCSVATSSLARSVVSRGILTLFRPLLSGQADQGKVKART